MPPFPRPRRRFGCAAAVVVCAACFGAIFAIMGPWVFQIGDRWTPTTAWHGVGRLRDSSGAEYGLYLYFYPDMRRHGGTSAGHRPLLQWPLTGKASVCTFTGARYRFNLGGSISGAWAHTGGAQMAFSLTEPRGPGIRRAFRLYGEWQGQVLPLDDHKTMFMNIRPGGDLTPTGHYTSPVPEKHATVTLEWGAESDFDALCGAVRGPGR